MPVPDSATASLRDSEIARFGVLGEAPGPDLRDLVELTAQLCDVSSAAVNLITDKNQHQVATVGVEPSVCRREDSMCAVVVDEPEPVVVTDARADDRFRDNPFVNGSIGTVRFYASAPLITPRGVHIGRLCAFDEEPRTLTARQARALRMLADRVVDLLELRRRGRELEESLRELIRTQDELHRSNKRLAFFAAQVSHDLRTPLTAMLLTTEAVAQEPAVTADPALSGMLRNVLDSGRRMSALIDEVLEFAQVGSSLRMAEVDVAAVVASAVHDLAPLVRDRSAEVRVGDLPTVVADERSLYSVFLNLVSNAVKYSRPGVPPVVDVGALRLEERWRFEVADNGIGIPDEKRTAVFLPFERGDTPEPGSGIGLSTAKRIIEAHGGRIGLASRPGGGTTAWFELPH